MPAEVPDFDLILDKIGPDRYSSTAVLNGKEGASCEFDYRMGTLATRQDLQRIEHYAVSGEAPPEDFHIKFGKALHDKALGGKVGESFAKASKKGATRLRIRTADGAPELEKLPWELLHDGSKFLAVQPGVLMSRLPAGIERQECGPTKGHLRMLVIISSPTDLDDREVLRVEREEEIILEATEKLRRDRKLQIDFVEDASMRTIEEYLDETDYQIIHFTGHGRFDEDRDDGFLLLQDEQGKKREVSVRDFAEVLAERETLRLVVLSACQTAQRSSNPALPGLAHTLLRRGIPAVLAMQHSIRDSSALAFAKRLYITLGAGRPIDEAVQRGRSELLEEGKGSGLDFVTPVLSLNDPSCIKAKEITPAEKELEAAQHVLSGGVAVMRTGFVGRRRELRQMREGFRSGQKRAYLIHGIGGIGKSVLATRLADSLRGVFDGWVGIKCNLDTKPEDILIQINAFLNMAGVNEFNEHIHAPVKTPQKVDGLVPILCKHRFLVILDNCEDLLESGRAVKGDAEGDARHVIADPDMADLLERLLNGVSEGSKLVITTRYDFEPLGEAGRLAGQIEHVQLGEMSFAYAVFIMESLPTLANLPVAPPPMRPGEPVPDVGPTKLEIYGRIGGHPFAYGQFERLAAKTSVGEVLLDLGELQGEMARMGLLDRIWGRLSDRARELCRRASIFEEPVPLSGLQWLMGDDKNRGPDVRPQVDELLGWGLVSRVQDDGEAAYAEPEMVRSFAREKLTGDAGRKALLTEAGRFLWARAEETRYIWDALRARDYLHRAGEYEEAYEILGTLIVALRRWGYIGLLLRMLAESARTLGGHSRATARGELAIQYYQLGDYERARSGLEAALTELVQASDRAGVAGVLHQLGMIHEDQGDYGEAAELYEQSLQIDRELGDKAGIAKSLHGLGVVRQSQGDYDEAAKLYEESLKIERDLEDEAGIAASLAQLSILRRWQGDHAGAATLCERALATFRELGDKAGIARMLFQLGGLCMDRGEGGQASKLYEQALGIAQGLGDRDGVARVVGQLAVVKEEQGDFRGALEGYLTAFEALAELGSPDAETVAHNITLLRRETGEEEFRKAWKEITGDEFEEKVLDGD